MQMISYHTGVLGDMAKGSVDFDAAMAQAAAANLKHLAAMAPATLWTDGSEQGAVEGSRAKPEIWSDPAGFAAKFKVLEDASAALMDVADLDALRAGMGGVGGSCKGCHQGYRGPKN
jgi:cytochrome c556